MNDRDGAKAPASVPVSGVGQNVVGGRTGGYLLVLTASLSWSTSGLFVTYILRDSGPSGVVLAFWRDLGALVCLAAALALFRPFWLRVDRQDLLWLAAAGGIGIGVFHAFWNLSVAANGVAVAGAINHTSTAFAAVAARILWREPLTLHKRLALAFALAGSFLVFGLERLLQSQVSIEGLLLALASGATQSAYGVFGRAVTDRHHPLAIAAWAFAFAVLVLLPFQFWSQSPRVPAPAALRSYAGLVLVSTIIGFSAYAGGLRRTSVTVAGILSSSTAVFHQIWAYVFLGERLQPPQVLGVALVIASAVTLVLAPSPAVAGDMPQGAGGGNDLPL